MLRNKWYLICPSKDLKNEIMTHKILGEDIILFRSKEGERLSALRCVPERVFWGV